MRNTGLVNTRASARCHAGSGSANQALRIATPGEGGCGRCQGAGRVRGASDVADRIADNP